MKKILFILILIGSFCFVKPVFALQLEEPKISGLQYINDSSVKILYKTFTYNTNYKVQIYNMTNGKYYSTGATTTEYTLTGLDTGKTYNIIMRVYYGTSVSEWSDAMSVTPKEGVPVINSITVGDKELTLNYTANGKPSSIEIFNYNTKSKIKSTNLSKTTISSLTNGTTYKFVMRNCYSNGKCSNWSNVLSAVPMATPAPISSHTTITATALKLAWPYGCGNKHTWSKGGPTAAYKSALDKVYPNHNKWGKCPKKGASCDVFVGTVIRASGWDTSFPRGLSEQFPYLKKKTNKWTQIKYTGKESQLQSGDVIAYDYKGNGAHILIYVKTPNGTGRIAEAGLCHSYGRLTKYRKIVAGGKNIWVRAYRATDPSYR